MLENAQVQMLESISLFDIYRERFKIQSSKLDSAILDIPNLPLLGFKQPGSA